MRIEDLSDFPALSQLARALWKQGKTRGAAVFVGAGFSLNARRVHEGAANPPLWSDLADVMEARIGSAKDWITLRLMATCLFSWASTERYSQL